MSIRDERRRSETGGVGQQRYPTLQPCGEEQSLPSYMQALSLYGFGVVGVGTRSGTGFGFGIGEPVFRTAMISSLLWKYFVC
jgi:hypothetical protein